MAGKGLQEPFLLPTHLTQDTQQSKQPFQLVSLVIEKAFDCIGHEIFVQALRAFVVLEIFNPSTMALHPGWIRKGGSQWTPRNSHNNQDRFRTGGSTL
jgi:hypothetical protein